MNSIKKLYSILTIDNKKNSIIFFILLIFATIFEIYIALIVPAITILLKSELSEKLDFIYTALEKLSNYTSIDYVTLGLSILILVFLFKNIFLLYYSWLKFCNNS